MYTTNEHSLVILFDISIVFYYRNGILRCLANTTLTQPNQITYCFFFFLQVHLNSIFVKCQAVPLKVLRFKLPFFVLFVNLCQHGICAYVVNDLFI